jgi:nucleoside-diphosphate-sugar epimerase
MTAVVTGSAGFIGQSLVRALLAVGEGVIGVDRLPQREQPGLTALTADLLDGDELVTAALRSADVVFHLAGCPGVRDTRPDVRLRRHRDNVLASAMVLDTVPLRTPLVVASSSSVYGGSQGGRPCTESDPLAPRGGYSRSKVAVEMLCRTRGRRGGLVTVVRPFTVAGEGQRPDMALAQWISAARAGRPLRLYGSPERTRDVTDVRDVARALVLLGSLGRQAQGPVNVGTGVGHTLGAMVAAVSAALGMPVDWYVERADSAEVSDTLADTRRLGGLVGFVPETDLAALVARQVAAAEARYVSEPRSMPGTRAMSQPMSSHVLDAVS